MFLLSSRLSIFQGVRMINNSKFKAVLFDIDGLMLDTEIVSYRGWKQACEDFGYVLDDATYHKVIGLIVPDMKPIFDKAFGRGFPLQEADRKRLKYMYDYFEKFGVTFKPGLQKLLDFIDKYGLLKAVATSSSRESAMKKLTLCGLVDQFDVIVTGDDVSKGKPAPDIFLAAADKLKILPCHCIVFEDSENGVLAAHNANMPVIMVPDVKRPTRQTAELSLKVFDTLSDAIPFLEKIFNGKNKKL
jgi:HAD superfamily hydrolase (TIGR01509 family)